MDACDESVDCGGEEGCQERLGDRVVKIRSVSYVRIFSNFCV